MIVATAGHIDHGKTTLIEALTGTDTTHLPEERKRGMTIDLGFAALALADGGFIGFVDVPGHERFVQNMLAGITGIDLALLVVAADDGIMPQTREHLEILDLLGVAEGAAIITKIDRVGPSRLEEVMISVHELMDATTLAGSTVFPVSATHRKGIGELHRYIANKAATGRPRQTGAGFRMPVDRHFSVEGAGPVVTGTVSTGAVEVGDRLILVPPGKPVRIRGLHSHHRKMARVAAGERCALNLSATDLGHSSIGRGQWVVEPGIAVTSRHIDARIRPAAGSSITDNMPVRFCHGASATPGRLLTLSPATEPGLVQIVFETPVHVLARDRFILRSGDGRSTVAGGVVIDPFPPVRGRRRPERIRMLKAMDPADSERALARLLAVAADGVELERFAVARNLGLHEAEDLWERVRLIQFEGRGYDPEPWHQGRQALTAEVERFHTEQPESYGPLAAELLLAEGIPGGRIFRRALLDGLIRDKELVRDGPRIRRPEHKVELSVAESAFWQRIAPLLGPDCRPMTVHDIARRHEIEYRVVERVLERALRAGLVTRINDRRFLHKPVVPELAARVEALARAHTDGLFDAGEFRDRSGLGRRISIEVLEYFDRAGFTQRAGDRRRVLRPAAGLWTDT